MVNILELDTHDYFVHNNRVYQIIGWERERPIVAGIGQIIDGHVEFKPSGRIVFSREASVRQVTIHVS